MSEDETARDLMRIIVENVPSPDRVTTPTRVTRAEAELVIAEASTSDFPEMQALARRLRFALDNAPAQTVFHFWPEQPS